MGLPVLQRNRCPVCKQTMRPCCISLGCKLLKCDEDQLLWNPVTQRAAAIRDGDIVATAARLDQRAAAHRDKEEKR